MKASWPHKDIQSWYDTLGAQWGHNYASGDIHFKQRIYNVHLLTKELGENAEILDVGCATGEITDSLHLRFKCKAVGIDISNKMVDYCNSKFKDSNVSFEGGNILSLQFSDNRFDLIVTLSVIEWIDNFEKAIAEMARVLKPGGQCIVSLPNWGSVTRKAEYLKSLCTSHSYLKYQKNRIAIYELCRTAESYGLEVNDKLYHVMPFYSSNLKGLLGTLFGAMCFVSFSKKDDVG